MNVDETLLSFNYVKLYKSRDPDLAGRILLSCVTLKSFVPCQRYLCCIKSKDYHNKAKRNAAYDLLLTNIDYLMATLSL